MLKSYLKNRKQYTNFKGNDSENCKLEFGVPQRSVLGPLLFLIYINDIINNIETFMTLFADDGNLIEVVDDKYESYYKLSADLDTLAAWADQWLVKFNVGKTKEMIISKKTILFFIQTYQWMASD